MNHETNLREISRFRDSELTSPDAKREALTRVLESAAFRRSSRLREFLEFIGTKTVDGRVDEITEQKIGIEVFHRGASFSPSEDNIVRATARALRTKLREYYDSEGALDPYRIEIPKGSYVPNFLDAADHPQPLPPGPIVQNVPDWRGRRLLIGSGLLLIASLGLLCAFLLWENRHLKHGVANAVVPQSLLGELLAPDCTVTIIASDALHTRFQAAQGSLTNVEEYASRSIFSSTPPLISLSPDLLELIRTEPLTQGDDVRAAVQLARSISSTCDVKLSHARSVGMSTFQSGNDFLILAGRRANPWAGLFEKDLQFEMVFPNATGTAVFVNRNPQPGEQQEYRTQLNDRQTGVAYGRVAVMPGLYGKGRVLLVAGTSGETTFAATDFLTQPRGLREVQERLGKKVDESLSRMEVLIETSAIGGGTKDFRIVAVR